MRPRSLRSVASGLIVCLSVSWLSFAYFMTPRVTSERLTCVPGASLRKTQSSFVISTGLVKTVVGFGFFSPSAPTTPVLRRRRRSAFFSRRATCFSIFFISGASSLRDVRRALNLTRRAAKLVTTDSSASASATTGAATATGAGAETGAGAAADAFAWAAGVCWTTGAGGGTATGAATGAFVALALLFLAAEAAGAGILLLVLEEEEDILKRGMTNLSEKMGVKFYLNWQKKMLFLTSVGHFLTGSRLIPVFRSRLNKTTRG